MSHSQLNQMKNVDIRTVNKAALPDVSNFHLDNGLSKKERAARILALLPNPYCFRCGDTVIKLEFTDNGPPLQEMMSQFLIRQKSGL